MNWEEYKKKIMCLTKEEMKDIECRAEKINSEKVIHALKLVQPYFNDVKNGIKTFEIRRNDRNYKVGDILVLREYDPFTDTYTDDVIKKKIVYITDYAQQQNFVVMGIK